LWTSGSLRSLRACRTRGSGNTCGSLRAGSSSRPSRALRSCDTLWTLRSGWTSRPRRSRRSLLREQSPLRWAAARGVSAIRTDERNVRRPVVKNRVARCVGRAPRIRPAKCYWRTLRPSRARRTLRAGCASRTSWTRHTLRTRGSGRASGSLRAGRSLWTLRSSRTRYTCGTRRTLLRQQCPLRRAAVRLISSIRTGERNVCRPVEENCVARVVGRARRIRSAKRNWRTLRTCWALRSLRASRSSGASGTRRPRRAGRTRWTSRSLCSG
jgi:hypothetical protein